MDQLMMHSIKKDMIFYGVYSTTFDMWNGSDVLCSARKRYFETGARQKKRSSIKIDDATYSYNYNLESGALLKYRRTKGQRVIDRVLEIPDGYVVEQYDEFHRPVKRAFYNSRHLWLRTEYLNTADGSVALLIAPGFDSDKPSVILKAASRSEVLVPFDVSLDKELTGRLNIMTSEPKVFCITSCGSFYFCTESEYEERMDALNKLISEQQESEPDVGQGFAESDFVVDTSFFEGSGGGFDLRSSKEIRISDSGQYEEMPETKPEVEVPTEKTDTEPETKPEIEEAAEKTETEPETKPEIEVAAEKTDTEPETKPEIEVAAEKTESEPETKPEVEEAAEKTESEPETKPEVEEAAEKTETEPETKPEVEVPTEKTETEPETKPEIEEAAEKTDTEPETKPEEDESGEEAAEPVEDAIFGGTQKKQEPAPYEGCDFAGECPYESSRKKRIDAGRRRYYYIGDIADDKRSGRGRTLMSNGQTAYEGSYLDDKRDGFGVYYYKSGKLCYAGGWKDNKRDGLGAAFSPADGSAVVGRWSEDVSVEVAAHFDNEGRLLFAGSVKNGRKNGAGMFYDPEGKTYFVGRFRDGEFLESGTQFSIDGDMLYTGGYKDNKRCGEGTSYNSDGSVRYKGCWKDNKYDGEGTLYLDDGRRISGTFMSGKAHGECVLKDKSGSVIYKGSFADDNYSGSGRLFFSDGSYAEGSFSGGETDGEFREYSPQKELVYSGDWTNKRSDGAQIGYNDNPCCGRNGQGELYSKGVLVYKGAFKDGRREGFGTEYRDGQIIYKGMWSKDLYNGLGMLYKDKEVHFVGSFSDGEMEGRINEVSDHRVVRKSLYRSNELVYTCEYSPKGELQYYGSISSGMRNGMGCTFLANSEKQFEGIFRSNEPEKPMKVLFKELAELPLPDELKGTEYETYRITPEYLIEKSISVGETTGIYTGRLKNGVPDGSGTMLYSDHRYTGIFSKGKPEGEGIVYMHDGEEHKGYFSVSPFPESRTMILADITYFYKETN